MPIREIRDSADVELRVPDESVTDSNGSESGGIHGSSRSLSWYTAMYQQDG